MKFCKKYLCSLFLILFILFGCESNKKRDINGSLPPIEINDEKLDFSSKGLENLNASHKLTDIVSQCWNNKEDAEFAKGLDASNIEIVYRGYCLFSDGSMVKDPRGTMQTGRWEINDEVKPMILTFSLNAGETEKYQLAYLAPYEMKLAFSQNGKKTILDLSSEALRYADPKKDPFHISNNSWRVKPGKAESDEEIKQRLKDCIHFYILYYDQKINAHSDEISFVGLPSCFKWYGGGIFLQKQNEIQDKWANCFYNKQQALKAYHIADRLLSEKYNWPKTGNWLMKNVAVLRQMEVKINAL
ncbi:MAG: hypothetical protein ABIO04_05385 [Ferruginibacter sp.]